MVRAKRGAPEGRNEHGEDGPGLDSSEHGGILKKPRAPPLSLPPSAREAKPKRATPSPSAREAKPKRATRTRTRTPSPSPFGTLAGEQAGGRAPA